jgi:hypothetical protein
MFDMAILITSSIIALGLLMWACAAWCDLALWAIDAVSAKIDKVRQ